MPEKPLTQNAVYSAIPTIEVDGQFNKIIANQILGMEMREQEGGMSSLELRLSNFGQRAGGVGDMMFEDGKILKLGAELKVLTSDVDSPTEIFRGKVTAIVPRFAELSWSCRLAVIVPPQTPVAPKVNGWLTAIPPASRAPKD